MPAVINTINSWWCVTRSIASSVTFDSKKIPGILAIIGSGLHCIGSGNQFFSVAAEPNITLYNWSYSGTGVTIAGTGTSVELNYLPGATPGILTVFGHNDACGDGPVNSLAITLDSVPEVSLTPYTDECYTAPAFLLAGGQPEGGNYFVDGIMADSLYPFKEAVGFHSIIYAYMAPSGCPNSDTADILLRKGADCEGTVLLPNAFSPNDDSKNDEFRPLVKNISGFKMLIYNKWGQLIYTTEDAGKGWDGALNGEKCQSGLYSYTLTYGLSLRTSDKITKRGVFVLVR